jgi:adenine deaminase
VGFLTGFGLRDGAVATTVTWEQPGLLVVGASSEAMATAGTRVADLGGGWAVVDDGEVVAELPMQVAGCATSGPLAETADGLARVEAALREVGNDVDRPLLGLQTLTFVGVPRLKLTPSGYADVVGRTVVGLDPAG